MPPLQILNILETRFEIDVSNFQSVLDQVPELPIVLLSINGCMREGKSFVLSYFIRYLKHNGKGDWFTSKLEDHESFSWKSGSTRDTVGINIWSEPFITKVDGRDVAVLLLDSQGLFDPNTTEQQNPGIFAFSCLLSSVMIYNAKVKLEENVLDNIQKYSDYATAIASKSPQHQNTRPYFMFLIRDFEFTEEFEYGFHNKCEYPKGELLDPKNYYEKIFTDTTEINEMHENNRAVRTKIIECYQDIGMFLMPHPGKKFIKNCKTFPPDEDFQQLLKELTVHVMSNLVIKRVGTEEVTGTTLKHHIQSWAELCKSKEFPKAETIQHKQMQVENHAAYAKALDHFQNECDKMSRSSAMGIEQANINGICRSLLNDAILLYKNSRTLGDDNDVRGYVLDLATTCVKKFNDTIAVGKSN